MTSEAKNAVGWNAAIKAENEAAKVFQINEVKAKISGLLDLVW